MTYFYNKMIDFVPFSSVESGTVKSVIEVTSLLLLLLLFSLRYSSLSDVGHSPEALQTKERRETFKTV